MFDYFENALLIAGFSMVLPGMNFLSSSQVRNANHLISLRISGMRQYFGNIISHLYVKEIDSFH